MNTRTSASTTPWSLDEGDIRQYAYELYEESGRIPGHDLDHWLTAESRLNALVELCRSPAPRMDLTPHPTSGLNPRETAGARERRAVVEWGDRNMKRAAGLKSRRVRVH